MTAGSDESGDPFVRPDPARGLIGDAGYAARWAQAHRDVADPVAYRSGYVDLLTLDALMSEGYRLLDVGCGTAGYHRLLARHGSLVGIDPIPEMIETADRFRGEFDVRGAKYLRSTFEEFESTEPFDAIRLTGVYGWYLSWHRRGAVLEKAFRLLKPSGIVLLSYLPPRTLFGVAKAALAPARTKLIFRRRFLAMVTAAGLSPGLELWRGETRVLFAQRPADTASCGAPDLGGAA